MRTSAFVAAIVLAVLALTLTANAQPSVPPGGVEIVGVCPQGGTYEGGAVAIQVRISDTTGFYTQLFFDEMLKDGAPTVPIGTYEIIGLGLVEPPDAEEIIFYWVPAAGDAGFWEISFGVSDAGHTTTYYTSASVQVGVPDPDHVAWQPHHFEFASGSSFAGQFVLGTVNGADSTFGIVLPMIFETISGTAGFAADFTPGDVTVAPPWGSPIFESISYNIFDADGVSKDSLLVGAIDFGGPALGPSSTPNAVTLNATLLDAEGVIAVDTALLPPANQIAFNVNEGYDPGLMVVPTYSPGCFPVTLVRNLTPTIVCPPISSVGPIVFGNLVEIPGFNYDDSDGLPGPYTFNIVSIKKDGVPAVPTNMPAIVGDVFTWQTAADDAEVGLWEFCVTVSDGQDESSNQCCFTVEVIGQTPYEICIDNITALSNQDVSVCITLTKQAGLQLAGGFDLLVCYDATALTFNGATVGQALLDHQWEYWTYRLEGTNPGKIRIVAIADMNNSNKHPDSLNPQGVITCLNFHTTNDRTIACQKVPIRFCWEDCGDNTISSRDGNILWVASLNDGGIIDVAGEQIMCLDPDPWGYNASVVCAGCPSDKYETVPFITYCNGSVRIICPGEIDDRGDINLNGIPYEIADAVLFSNYLIWGTSVLDPVLYQAQIAATDINNDGMVCTLTDLVYLIRVIIGEAEPIPDPLGGPKVGATVGMLTASATASNASLTVRTQSDFDLGGVLMTFSYTGTEIRGVTLTDAADNMDVEYAAADGELRVLVYDIGQGRVAAGSHELVRVSTSGGGSLELVTIEAATYDGGNLETSIASKIVPQSFALHQNYPNPFNPSTALTVDFPVESQYTLSIYNIAGQRVKTFSGVAQPGRLEVNWDGTNQHGGKVASGVYFYRIQTDQFDAVRKMVLMK